MKEDDAAEGAPGLMTMVGNLTILPSRNPLRVYSLISSSHMSFVTPYVPCGAAKVDGMITSG